MSTQSMLAPFTWAHVLQWHLGITPNVLLALALSSYLAGVRRHGHWPLGATVSFLAAIVVTFLATQSVVGLYDMTYFSDHMIEHLALIMVAAPLFAFSRPIDLARATGPRWLQRACNSRIVTFLLEPLVAFAAYFVFIPLTHLTGLANLMMEHEWIHHGEQIGFLVVGYLFFRVAFGREEGRQIHPGLRLVFVMAAVPVDTVTGLTLAMSSHNPIPAYAAMAPMSYHAADVLGNVRLGGAIMWIGGDALMLLACIPIAIAWVRDETRRTRILDAELDRLGL